MCDSVRGVHWAAFTCMSRWLKECLSFVVITYQIYVAVLSCVFYCSCADTYSFPFLVAYEDGTGGRSSKHDDACILVPTP